MHDIAVFDETFDLNLSSTYSLSVGIAASGFTYCILDTIRNRYIGIKHYDFGGDIPEEAVSPSIEGMIGGDEILSKRFKGTRVMVSSSRSTLVPGAFFSEDRLPRIFRLNHPVQTDETLKFNRLSNAGSYMVYGVSSELLRVLDTSFPKAQLYHLSVPLIETALTMHKNRLGVAKLFIHCFGSRFDVMVLHENSLKFYNSFIFQGDDEFVYYIMNIFEQMQLNPEENELLLSGQIDEKSGHYARLLRYVKNVRFSKTAENFTYSYQFHGIPSHYFTNLFNLQKCE